MIWRKWLKPIYHTSILINHPIQLPISTNKHIRQTQPFYVSNHSPVHRKTTIQHRNVVRFAVYAKSSIAVLWDNYSRRCFSLRKLIDASPSSAISPQFIWLCMYIYLTLANSQTTPPRISHAIDYRETIQTNDGSHVSRIRIPGSLSRTRNEVRVPKELIPKSSFVHLFQAVSCVFRCVGLASDKRRTWCI